MPSPAWIVTDAPWTVTGVGASRTWIESSPELSTEVVRDVTPGRRTGGEREIAPRLDQADVAGCARGNEAVGVDVEVVPERADLAVRGDQGDVAADHVRVGLRRVARARVAEAREQREGDV